MPQPSELILKLLAEKAVLKKRVSERTIEAFAGLKEALRGLQAELKGKTEAIDKALRVDYAEKGGFEAEFSLAGDTLVFLMYTDVFTFDHNHAVWRTSYVKEDANRAFCGKIYVYSFLTDSFRYERKNDIGYLIARIFVNAENHFFVEGKRQLGFLYNDFGIGELTKEQLRSVAQSAILYSLDFDPYTPPYEAVNQISVQEILETKLHARITTGKRLGFRFQQDSDEIR